MNNVGYMEEFYPIKYDQEKQQLIPNNCPSPRDDESGTAEVPNYKLMQTVDKCLTRELNLLSPRQMKNLINPIGSSTGEGASLFSSFFKAAAARGTGASFELSEASAGASGMNHSSTANVP